MNIFHLSDSPHHAAIWQHDRHIVKMTLETAQLLSTAVWHNPMIRDLWVQAHGPMRDGIDSIDSGALRLYKSISNPNHPSAVWVRDSIPNFMWTIEHFNSLIGEYHRRFVKRHGCDDVRWSFNRLAEIIAGVDRYFKRDADRNLIIDPAIESFSSQHSAFAICMRPEFRLPGLDHPVEAYRWLYRFSKIFQDHVKWTRCDSLPAFLFDCPTSAQITDRLAILVAANVEQNTRPIVDTVSTPRAPRVVSAPRVATPSSFRFKFSA